MSENATLVKQAIKELGNEATFANLVTKLRHSMSLGQVRGTIAGLSQKKIRKGPGGVYQMIRRKRRKARGKKATRTKPATKKVTKRVTKKKAASRPSKRNNGRRRRRPSLLVKLDQRIADTEGRLVLLKALRRVAKKDPAGVQETLRSFK